MGKLRIYYSENVKKNIFSRHLTVNFQFCYGILRGIALKCARTKKRTNHQDFVLDRVRRDNYVPPG